jgi:hypothetical protein
VSFIKDWDKDIAGDGNGWVRAQMRKAQERCAYCPSYAVRGRYDVLVFDHVSGRACNSFNKSSKKAICTSLNFAAFSQSSRIRASTASSIRRRVVRIHVGDRLQRTG